VVIYPAIEGRPRPDAVFKSPGKREEGAQYAASPQQRQLPRRRTAGVGARSATLLQSTEAKILRKENLAPWVRSLIQDYEVIGPVQKGPRPEPFDGSQDGLVEGEEVVFRPVGSVKELALNYITTMLSPKGFLYPPREVLFTFHKGEGFTEVEPKLSGSTELAEVRKRIIFGVHPCDLNAILILDRVFLGSYEDAYYRARRENTLLVALTCNRVGENCFCASMGFGPSLEAGYDLLLTDLNDRYLVEIGSVSGQEMLKKAPLEEASPQDRETKERKLKALEEEMPKRVDTQGLPRILRRNLRHAVWARYKDICLACANCTMACPTCYCYDMIDRMELDLEKGVRERAWDSCFNPEFAQVHGGNFRAGRDSRLRQFVCHKMSYWMEQYGRFGCVGCGRCITWCPVGIDITEIVGEIRSDAG